MDSEDIEPLWTNSRGDPSNQDLRNRLLEAYSPLVKCNAERIWARLPEGVELDDLVSAGVLGLLNALEAFDPSHGVKFEVYAIPRIRGAMLDHLRSLYWVPAHVRQRARKLTEAADRLRARLGQEPDDEASLLPPIAKSLNHTERLVIILYCYEEL
jgi:RNA polymerase sigma factor for flagellar operon FliA